MRYVVLDTDVASRAIKGKLGDPLAARLTGVRDIRDRRRTVAVGGHTELGNAHP